MIRALEVIGRLFFVMSLASDCGFATQVHRRPRDPDKFAKGPPAPEKITLEQAESIAFRQAPLLGRASFDTQAAQQVIQGSSFRTFPAGLWGCERGRH